MYVYTCTYICTAHNYMYNLCTCMQVPGIQLPGEASACLPGYSQGIQSVQTNESHQDVCSFCMYIQKCCIYTCSYIRTFLPIQYGKVACILYMTGVYLGGGGLPGGSPPQKSACPPRIPPDPPKFQRVSLSPLPSSISDFPNASLRVCRQTCVPTGQGGCFHTQVVMTGLVSSIRSIGRILFINLLVLSIFAVIGTIIFRVG